MSRIERLTPEQKARFPEYVERWTRIGLSTDPADRPRAEAAIRQIYVCGGLSPPERIVWCGSPMGNALTRAVLLDKKIDAWDSVRDSVMASVGASVGASVTASIWTSVRASILESVKDSVMASVGDSVTDSVWARFGASVRDSVWGPVGISIWRSVGDSVGASAGASVRDSVWASVGASVWDSVTASVEASVWASVGASVGASVRDSVMASVRDSLMASAGASVGASVWDSAYGQHDASWLGFYRYFHDECGLTRQTEKLAGLWELCQSAGWAIPHKKICLVSERHNVLHRDERGRLHCLTGPACAYPDGWGIYAVHGVRVPEYIIERPQEITCPKIEQEINVEVRRVMIERYGQARYIKDSGAQLIQEIPDNYFLKGLRTARLYRKELPQDEPIVMLDMLNSTAEPDGTFKRYMLRVDPNAYDGLAAKDCLAAMASTWRNEDGSLVFRRPQDYRPVFES